MHKIWGMEMDKMEIVSKKSFLVAFRKKSRYSKHKECEIVSIKTGNVVPLRPKGMPVPYALHQRESTRRMDDD